MARRRAPPSAVASPRTSPHSIPDGLRDCQFGANTNLETSLKPRPSPAPWSRWPPAPARPLPPSRFSLSPAQARQGARRVLFLVDTRNLGEQAEQEFIAFTPTDDNRSFTSNSTPRPAAHLLPRPSPNDSQVCHLHHPADVFHRSRIEEMTEGAEDEHHPAEASSLQPSSFKLQPSPLPVVYNARTSRPSSSMSSSSMNATAPSTTSGARSSNTSTPSWSASPPPPTNVPTDSSSRTSSPNTPTRKAVADKRQRPGNETYLIETEVTQQGGEGR